MQKFINLIKRQKKDAVASSEKKSAGEGAVDEKTDPTPATETTTPPPPESAQESTTTAPGTTTSTETSLPPPSSPGKSEKSAEAISETTTDKSQSGPGLLDRVMAIILCKPCIDAVTTPVIAPEETEEEAERRIKKEKKLQALKVELERREKESIANSIETVIFNESLVEATRLRILGAEVKNETAEEVIQPPEIGPSTPQEGETSSVAEPCPSPGPSPGPSPDPAPDPSPAITTAPQEKTKEDSEYNEGDTEKKKNKTEEELEKIRMEELLAKYGNEFAENTLDSASDSDSIFSSNKYTDQTIETQSKTKQQHTSDTLFFNDVERKPSDVKIQISSLHTPPRAAKLYSAAILSYTSKYVAAKRYMFAAIIKIQCQHRINIALQCVEVRKREYAEELLYEEKLFLQEKENWNRGYDRFLDLCHHNARRVAHAATNYWRTPAAAVIIQRYFRGFRVRLRISDFRRRVLAQRKRKLERARYNHALSIVYSGREEDNRRKEEIDRRKYARRSGDGEEPSFSVDRGGWKPSFVGEDLNFWTHIWKPPKGGGYGIRNLKVKLPCSGKWDTKIAATDENAWLGIPVMCCERNEHWRNLGPPERQVAANLLKKPAIKKRGGGGEGCIYETKYNWVPAPFVQPSEILQEQYRREEER